MKKTAVSLLLLFVLTLPTCAWDWGAEGGVALSRFKAAKGLMSKENRTGWFIGPKLKSEIPLPNLGFDVALLYYQNKLAYMNAGNEAHKKLHMFVIPLNLRYGHKFAPKFGIYMATGPQWNWYIGKADIGGMGELNHSFFGWNVGAGIEVFRHVELGFNYSIPLGKMGVLNNVDLEGRTWNFRAAFFL